MKGETNYCFMQKEYAELQLEEALGNVIEEIWEKSKSTHSDNDGEWKVGLDGENPKKSVRLYMPLSKLIRHLNKLGSELIKLKGLPPQYRLQSFDGLCKELNSALINHRIGHFTEASNIGT